MASPHGTRVGMWYYSPHTKTWFDKSCNQYRVYSEIRISHCTDTKVSSNVAKKVEKRGARFKHETECLEWIRLRRLELDATITRALKKHLSNQAKT